MAMTRTERKLGGQMTARLLGFLRPPDSWAQAPERLLTCASYSAAVLTIRGIGSLQQPVRIAYALWLDSCRGIEPRGCLIS
jgi:hypothetical protein